MVGSALVMLGIGSAAAIILAAAAKVFYVEIDPRVIAIEDNLPGANCGGCGYTGCSACAEAIVEGDAEVNACLAGGPDCAAKIAAVMGGEVGFVEPKIAERYCTGGDRAVKKYHYDGAMDCRAMAELYDGDLLCQHGCLGLSTCIIECPFDALSMGPEGYPEVDASRCVGCGNCERVCPVNVITLFSLSERLLHFNTDEECLSPCKQMCPAQIDIPAYVEFASQGKYLEAVNIIKERNPLPLVCGRVCPAPCEVGCRRVAIEDEPVHHNYIKRFVADWEMGLDDRQLPTCLPDSGKHVAIVGGGPSGLTAAYFLRRLGHGVTIYDDKPAFGGMLRYGIPEYRLPKKTLDYEIQQILDLGCEAVYKKGLGSGLTVSDLEKDNDAVLLAMGAWDNSSMRIEGEDDGLEGVWKGTEFLQKRELGETVDLTGKKVVVVGGGNTAMDACRSSLRMGAGEVILLYRRTRAEMPANAVEIDASEHEGVKYQFLAAPTKIVGVDGVLKQIEYLKMELGEPDASGRRRPVPIEGSETLLDVDVVIAAIGQRPRSDWLGEDMAEKLSLTRWNTIEADDETLQTAVPKVFTSGDIWTGPGLAVTAIGNGRQAARSIHLFLSGEDMSFPEGASYTPKEIAESKDVLVFDVKKQSMVPQPELDAHERIKSYVEVDLVVTPELMQVEANRCLRCGTVCYFSDGELDHHKKVIDGTDKNGIEKLEKLLRYNP